MKDLMIEIWSSLRRNKMRTILTGFSVFWGIFMLIVLLGAGKGLINSFNQDSEGLQMNSMMIGGNYTSEPYAGYKAGRAINMNRKDMAVLKNGSLADKVEDVTATVTSNTQYLSFGKKHFSASFMGVFPEYIEIERVKLIAGRFIDAEDMTYSKKVVVLTTSQVDLIQPGIKQYDEIIGKKIKIGNISFLIVGVSKSDDSSLTNTVFIPLNTNRTLFSKGNNVDVITFTFNGVNTEEDCEKFEDDVTALINLNHQASPTDKSAIWIWDRLSQRLQMIKMGSLLNTSMWIIGLLTLISGVVGVSNIMLITVKERTHEFGIRKAIGATPWSITSLIVTESVLITSFFGYFGMVSGMIVCEILDKTVGQEVMDVMGESVRMLIDPTVSLGMAIEATIVLVVAGTVAGLFPARKAARVKPIEALRAD